MANRVTCINKQDRQNPWERITHLGGTRDDNGNRWKITQKQCIEHIENGAGFYVQKSNHRVWLEVAVSSHGNKYVKTEADHDTQDNLLSLPECK